MNAPATFAPTALLLDPRTQNQLKLEARATAAWTASKNVDPDGSFLHRATGISLVHAIYDVIEVDAVYDLADDLEREFGPRETSGDREHAADVRYAETVRR